MFTRCDYVDSTYNSCYKAGTITVRRGNPHDCYEEAVCADHAFDAIQSGGVLLSPRAFTLDTITL